METSELQSRMRETVRASIDGGGSIDELMAALRQQSSSPMETIRAIRAVTGISLGQAKDLIAASEVWRDLQSHADDVHRLLFEALAREGALWREGDKWVLRIDLDSDPAR